MSSFKDIKRRMKSIKDIHKVTRAMKMVSIAKLRKAERNLEESKIRYEKLENIFVKKIINLHRTDTPKLLIDNKQSQNVVYMLISSNKGLCGAFNKNVFKKFRQIYTEKKGNVCAIGKKAISFVRREGLSVHEEYLFPNRDNFYKFAQNLTIGLLNDFRKKEINVLKVISSKNVSPIRQNVQVEQLIPFRIDEEKLKKVEKSKHMCEPSDFQFTKSLTEELIITELFYILRQSAVAEHTARMNAMDAASDNASELLDDLTIAYNKARQAAITKEIVEIASTAEALKE